MLGFYVLKSKGIASVFLPDYQWRWLPAHGPVCCASVATLTTLGFWQGSKCSSPACKNAKANPFRERLVAERVVVGWQGIFLSLLFSIVSRERRINITCGSLLAFTVFLVWDVNLAEIKPWTMLWYQSRCCVMLRKYEFLLIHQSVLWCRFPSISWFVEMSSGHRKHKWTTSNCEVVEQCLLFGE